MERFPEEARAKLRNFGQLNHARFPVPRYVAVNDLRSRKSAELRAGQIRLRGLTS